MESPEGCAETFTHNRTISSISKETWLREHRWDVLNMSVNNFWPCIIQNARAARQHLFIIELSAAFQGGNGCDNIATMSLKRASTERQQLLDMYFGTSNGWVATLSHNHTIGHLSRRKSLRQHGDYVLKMNINTVSMILGLVSWKMQVRCGEIQP